jgi:ribosomal protein S6--L-glutamate ligase
MKIYLLTRNANLYSSRRLLEAAAKRGHDVKAIDYMHCNLIIEKGRCQILYKGDFLEMPDAIIPRIGATNTFFGSAVIRQFEMMNVFSAVDSDALLRSRNKFKCLQLLSMQGVDMPITAFADTSNDANELISAVGGTPLIIKLLEGTQGLGVLLAETKNGAKSILDAFSELKAKVIVQEFVKESRGIDIRAFVVGNKVVAAMQRTAPEGEFRSNIHRGGVGTHLELDEQEIATALNSAKALGLGVAGVDMLRSSRGPLVIEVNSSPGLEGIEGFTGIDVADEVIQYLENPLIV